MTLDELVYYGRYYSFEDEGYHYWWFDLRNAVVYQYDEIINKFGYSSQEEILASQCFVPLFETDIIKLEHEFLLNQNYNQYKIINNRHSTDFDTTFKVFIEKNDLLKVWHDFEYRRLYEDAIAWCHKHNIGNSVLR